MIVIYKNNLIRKNLIQNFKIPNYYISAENIKNDTILYLFYTLYTNTWYSMFLNPIDIFWEVNKFNHYIMKNKLVLFLA